MDVCIVVVLVVWPSLIWTLKRKSEKGKNMDLYENTIDT